MRGEDRSARVGHALRGWAPVLIALALGVAWLLASPPGSAPDEPSHYMRAIGMGRGDVIGGDVPVDEPTVGFQPEQLPRVNTEAGRFTIPGALRPQEVCNAFRPEVPWVCPPPQPLPGEIMVTSVHGRYLPLSYVVPGLLARAATTSYRAMLLTRLGFLLQNVALLAVAVRALRAARLRPSPAAAGLLVLSATPLLAYQTGTLAPNATETWALLAFVAAAIAAVRRRSSRWWWIAAATAVVATWSRDLGLILVVVFAPAIAIAVPGSAAWARERLRTRDAAAVALVAAAGAGAVVWQLALKASPGPRWHGFVQLWQDVGTLPRTAADSIGLLGWLDLPMDPAVQAVWAVAWVAALAVLLARSPGRVRILATYLALAWAALNLVLISSLREAGFGVQSRFTLSIPIVLAILVALHDGTREDRATLSWGLRSCCAIAAVGHAVAFGRMAHRQANGIGNPVDFTHVAWAPAGGWWPALALGVVASAMFGALAWGRRATMAPEPAEEQT